MSKDQKLVQTLLRLGPEQVVDGRELCPQCDGLSPGLGFRRNESGEHEEFIMHCSTCNDIHIVSVEDADRWREAMRKRYGDIRDE
jgi:hypothetical protein